MGANVMEILLASILHRHGSVMLATILIAANMCLQGGEQADVTRYVEPTASWLELKWPCSPQTECSWSLAWAMRSSRHGLPTQNHRLDTLCGTRLLREGYRRSI